MKVNKEEIVIRNVTIDDIDKLVDIEKSQNTVILKHQAILDDLTINQTSTLYLCACYNGVIIGYIATHYVIDTMDILSVVTAKDYENNGIATLLLRQLFDFAKGNEICNLFLEVRKSNKVAIKLYEHFGFKMIHIRENYYKDNHEDAYIYTREI